MKSSFRAVLHKHLEYKPSRYVHHDLLPERIKRDESDVSRVIESIQCSFINSFGEENDLVILSSGVRATEKKSKIIFLMQNPMVKVLWTILSKTV